MKKVLSIFALLLSNLTFGQNTIQTGSVAKVYDIPDVKSKVLTTIPYYTIVQLTGMVETPNAYDKYFRVVYNGTTGWIYNIDICFNELYYSALRKYFPKIFVSGTGSAPSTYIPYVPPPVSNDNSSPTTTTISTPAVTTSVSNPYETKTIQLTRKGSGTFLVRCSINGLKMDFIFDTGASDVSISLTEALFMLKNGYLKPKDVLGKQLYSNANGVISEGTQIIIREIEFGGLKIYNVAASVVDELDAPLLLGQSAISKLGRIEIDYYKNTLTVIK